MERSSHDPSDLTVSASALLESEYLLDRPLTNNLINLGIYDVCRNTLGRIGVDLGLVEESEQDAAWVWAGSARTRSPGCSSCSLLEPTSRSH